MSEEEVSARGLSVYFVVRMWPTVGRGVQAMGSVARRSFSRMKERCIVCVRVGMYVFVCKYLHIYIHTCISVCVGR